MMTVITAFLSSSLPVLGLCLAMGCAALAAWRNAPAPQPVPVRVRSRRR
ncbi:hypothetical protein [Gluconacetobacter takamatsuzukensis]|uniref:Lipoprotein n=1 Tax=Gluconacetobacter takamatsuzukensis TaxID=1286190 RepID=A0A7W4KBV3_9PROT|nr:hypothetical protein [Gluconacetobacter takamatsuzukensis]MBB2204092.1 hypothetical protein [Gluconacetobacter takamatsuzukensis]